MGKIGGGVDWGEVYEDLARVESDHNKSLAKPDRVAASRD